MSLNKDIENNAERQSGVVTRRAFLVGAGAAAIGATWLWSFGRQPITAEAAAAGAPKMVTIIGFRDYGTRTTKESVARVVKTDDEWRKQLSPAAFEVARRAATAGAPSGRRCSGSTRTTPCGSARCWVAVTIPRA